ncbi:MAG: hypothetical protein K2X77_18590 [Candidatus Obscuribacterales bacterium]|jgi:hypothetical protein|nr:hypothetical protein [Candidatus Obscuribacterales bacterium]
MKRILSALILSFLVMVPSFAQGPGTPGIGWHVGGDVVTNDMPFITISNQTGMSNERALSTHASFPELVLNDKGANSSLELQWSGQLPIARGGTGAATQQAAVNAILNFSSIASGDTIYYNGTNWVRLAKGSDGQVLTLASGLPSWSGSTAGAPDNATYLTLTTNGSLTSERTIAFGSGLTGTDGGAGSTYTIAPDLAVLADLSTSQSLTNKILVNPTLNDQVTVEKGAQDVVLTFAAPATSTRTINFPDPGANGDVVYTVSAQTITGIKTLTNPVFNDRFTFEKGAQDLVITAAAPATSSRTINFPDPGANGDVVYTVSAQTLGGIKTFTSQPVFPSTGFKISTANAYTIAGTNPSAARAYNLYDAGGDHDIAIKSGTPTSGGVAYGDGNKILFSAGGSDGQWLKRVSGAPTWTALPGAFGGDASDGAITISGATTYSGPIQKNTSSFTVDSSKTLTLDTASPLIINATGAITINGTITSSGCGGAGGAGGVNPSGSFAATGKNGAGPGGGSSPNIGALAGGGGGASGGDGGRGGGTASSTLQGAAGSSYWAWRGGGSGGGAGNGSTSATLGAGGAGGACIMLVAVGAITVSSTGAITSNGANGGNASGTACGGGGGGGGMVWLISQTSVTCQASSVITATGGNGGNDSGTGGGGGGGGGGRRVAWSPSNTLSGTTTLTAGSGGSGDGNGESGGAGVATSITGTPNLPLLAWVEQKDGQEYITTVEKIERVKGNKEVMMHQRALANAFAKGNIDQYAKAMTPGFDAETTCINMFDVVDEVLKHVS